MPEHAIAIARVSPGKNRREEDQIPGLKAFAEKQGYILADDHIIQIHNKSAFVKEDGKPSKHLKYVQAAIQQFVKNGAASVVLFRDVDRSSRGGAQAMFDLRGEIIRAGGRMEFSGQEYLNDQRTQEMLLGLLATAAREESETKSRRKLQGNGVKREKGELIGRVPWGYDAVIKNDIQVNITPNALGKEWIPRIFTAAVDGKSLTSIAGMLKGIPSPQGNGLWDDATIRRVIASTTYYGQMPNNPNMKFEALVTVEQWKQANLAVTSRLKRGRGTVKQDPALVKPFCAACWQVKRDGAPSGKSPMYRKQRFGHSYYSCTGHGPGRKSCGGPSIPLDALDAVIERAMSTDSNPHMVREYVAGDDNSERLAAINEKIAAAFAAKNYPLIAELSQQAEQIPVSKREGGMKLRESGQTVGQHWQTLTLAEKREELANWTVIAGIENGKVYAIIEQPSVDGKLGKMYLIGAMPRPTLVKQLRLRGMLAEAELDD